VWLVVPAYYRGKYKDPLWLRINGIIKTIDCSPEAPCHSLRNRLQELVACLRHLDQRCGEDDLLDSLKSAIEKCAQTSYFDKSVSLEDQISKIPTISNIATKREVAQVDKLSRYYGLCKDISRIATYQQYRYLFRRIEVAPLISYPGMRPPGTSKKCFVHAEVQLILFYEQNPRDTYPRAIGCSKSACFLCDLLIQELGKYQISFTHRRLYPQWTIPDTPWMTSEQVKGFREITNSMICEIRTLKRMLKHQQSSRRGRGIYKASVRESRVVLPLLSGSTITQMSKRRGSRIFTPIGMSQSNSTLSTQTVSSARSTGINKPISRGSTDLSLSLTGRDLPFQRFIHSEITNILLFLGDISIIFEFMAISAGNLYVKQIEGEQGAEGGNIVRFPVMTIPDSEEIRVSCSKTSNCVEFQLQYADSVFGIEFIWGAEIDN
jgi:hypothetical protein